MKYLYLDVDGTNRSRAFARMRALCELLPLRLRDRFERRIARRFVARMRLTTAAGTQGFARWGAHISCSGDGSVTLNGSFSIGSRVHFAFHKPGSLNLGDGARIDIGSILCADAGHIEIDAGVYVGPYSFVQSESNVHIGQDTVIGARCSILAQARDLTPGPAVYQQRALRSVGITIGRNVWVGHGVTIYDGVTIGDDAVINAGAVVSTAVPAGAVIGELAPQYRSSEPSEGVILTRIGEFFEREPMPEKSF